VISPQPVQAVLFDLDGTFADTAPDLAFALNATLQAFGRDPLPYASIRPVASHGGIGLVGLGFGLAPGEAGFEERRAHLLEVYRANICRESRLFDGMAEVVDGLESAGYRWGIVTNKPAWLTDPLMAALGYAARAHTVVSGDTCARRKPHPDPVQHACAAIGITPGAALYVGDAERDIAAGRAAGTLTAAARYGYILPGEDPLGWQANFQLDHCRDLPALLDSLSGAGLQPAAEPG
jgi:phosphoglycolate phosphatase